MRTILHSDMNAFYASVELLYHPALRGKPVAVGGDPELRHGIVLAKSQEAKRCGVKTGMALWEARQCCPDIIFIPPHYDRYMRFSHAVPFFVVGKYGISGAQSTEGMKATIMKVLEEASEPVQEQGMTCGPEGCHIG